MQPDHLLLRWSDPQGEITERRIPRAAGSLPAVGAGEILASVEVAITASSGARKVVVRGYRGEVVSCIAAGRLDWETTSQRRFELTLARDLPDRDGDGTPDVIDDDCPGAAPCTSGQDGGQDGGTGALEGGTGALDAAVDARPAPTDTADGTGLTSDARVAGDAASAVDDAGNLCTATAPSETSLSSFESGQAEVLTISDRGPQQWYAFDDGSGGQRDLAVGPAPEGTCGNARALHATSSGFTNWGSGIGFGIRNGPGGVVAYDASRYAGLQFRARAASATSVDLQLLTTATSGGGGVCTVCDDHPRARVNLNTIWTTHVVRFDAFAQAGYGVPKQALADVAHLITVQLFLWKPGPFDVWIDDVAFVP